MKGLEDRSAELAEAEKMMESSVKAFHSKEEPAAGPAAAGEPPPAEPFPDCAPAEPGLDVGGASALEAPDQSEPASARPPDGATMVAGGPRLVAQTDDARTQEYTLGGSSMSIGRAPENEIRIVDESVSRKHAEIVLEAGGYLLRDLGTGDGTYINGERISEHHIIRGEVVQIGSVTLVFREV